MMIPSFLKPLYILNEKCIPSGKVDSWLFSFLTSFLSSDSLSSVFPFPLPLSFLLSLYVSSFVLIHTFLTILGFMQCLFSYIISQIRPIFFPPYCQSVLFHGHKNEREKPTCYYYFPVSPSFLPPHSFRFYFSPSVLSTPHFLNGIGWCNRQKERERLMFSQERERDSRGKRGKRLAAKGKNRRKVNQLEIEMQHIPSGNWKKHERWREIERKTSYQ